VDKQARPRSADRSPATNATLVLWSILTIGDGTGSILRHTIRKQRTIGTAVQVEGFGYWSGRDVCVEFRPAEPDTGIVFVRHDLDPPRRVRALVQNRIDSPLRTTLTDQGASVEMVEHIMAALAGLWIDNCEVWVDQPEMPGCDGSSLAFVEALLGAGIVQQPAVVRQLAVLDVVRVGNAESWVEARPVQTPGMTIKCRLDFGRNNPIGRQTFLMTVTPESFRGQLADSRTFIMKQEAERLLAQGLGQRTSCRDLLVFGETGPIGNQLRHEDECVRHKTAGLVGDLALAGVELVGYFLAHRSSHRLNAQLVQTLLQQGQNLQQQRRSA